MAENTKPKTWKDLPGEERDFCECNSCGKEAYSQEECLHFITVCPKCRERIKQQGKLELVEAMKKRILEWGDLRDMISGEGLLRWLEKFDKNESLKSQLKEEVRK